jgi:hypothetical protein
LTQCFDFRIVKFEGLFANISNLDYNEKERLLAIATNKGHVNLYRCEDSTQSLDLFNFQLLEDYDCVAKVHGDLDSNQEEANATSKLYNFKSHLVQIKFMLSQRSYYCYTLESLQYVYIRDYERKEVPSCDPSSNSKSRSTRSR